MIWYELTRWAAYRTIKHDAMRAYICTFPAAISIILTVGYYCLPVSPSISSAGGLLSGLLTLLATLPGFFIASLAAVATFNRPEMDETMPEPCPTVAVRRNGEWIDVKLTRRTFLTYLFSYLSILSLLACAMCVGGQVVGSAMAQLNSDYAVIKWIINFVIPASFLLALFFICSSILVSMLHGIYFIAERIHQPH